MDAAAFTHAATRDRPKCPGAPKISRRRCAGSFRETPKSMPSPPPSSSSSSSSMSSPPASAARERCLVIWGTSPSPGSSSVSNSSSIISSSISSSCSSSSSPSIPSSSSSISPASSSCSSAKCPPAASASLVSFATRDVSSGSGIVARTCGCTYRVLRGLSRWSKILRAAGERAKSARPSSRSSAIIAFAVSFVSSTHSTAHAKKSDACSSRAILLTCPFRAFKTALRCFAPACANKRFTAQTPSRVWIMRRYAGPARDCAASCFVPGPPTSRYSHSAACTRDGETRPFSKIGSSDAFIWRNMPWRCARGLLFMASRKFLGAETFFASPSAPPAPKNANSLP
mmetsp:Transcript_385/g.1507  ORF Transcript_385/g.1507 Transcript_385/m.1507 type:complete len:342 (-) Transcript_385:1031-2056(-)